MIWTMSDTVYNSSYLSDVFEYDPGSNYWRMARTGDMQGMWYGSKTGVK